MIAAKTAGNSAERAYVTGRPVPLAI